MSELWKEMMAIQSARRDKLHEAMKDYDETVYGPAMKSLRERCAAIGHQRGRFHNNGLGYSWYWCSQCGAQMEVEGRK